MILARKLLRQVRTQRGQIVAVVGVGSLGALLFVSSYASYENLTDSYAATRSRLALADLHVDASSVSLEDLRELRASPAVRVAEARLEIDVPISIERDDSRLTARLLSVPNDGEPGLDRILPVAGRLPNRRGEVAVEKHLADFHHVEVGDTFVLHGVDERLTVVGIGVTPEYLWVSRSPEDVMPTPDAFGVIWITREGARAAASTLTARMPLAQSSPALALAASDALGNKLLIEPSTDRGRALAAVRDLLGPRMRGAVVEEDLVGAKLLQLDVDGLRDMAIFFPIFFLVVGAFIVASIIGRMVDSETPIIGTLRALGASRGRIMSHYGVFAFGLGAAGALIGAAAGVPAGAAMTASYASELGIPFVTERSHFELAALAIGVGAAGGIVAGAMPAWRAARLPPASAMRGGTASSPLWLLHLARSLPRALPLPFTLALRNIMRRPVRSTATAGGVAAALTLVVTTAAVLDSTKKTIEVMFGEQQAGDLRVDWLGFEDARKLRADVSSLAGVTAFDMFVVLPVEVAFGGAHATTLAQALPEDARLVRPVDVSRGVVTPGARGAVLPATLAKKLGARRGDEVELRPTDRGPAARFRVDDVIDVPVGEVLTIRVDDAREVFSLGSVANAAALSTTPTSRAAVRRALEDLPGVGRVEDAAALRASVEALMGLAWVVLGFMLALSVALAAAILFNTATLSVLERRRDIATLRAMGQSMSSVAMMLTLENAMLAAGGGLAGVPLSRSLVREVMHLFSSDLMTFPVVFSPRTFLIAIAGAVLVLLIAQWPALRLVARMSLPTALRLRSQ